MRTSESELLEKAEWYQAQYQKLLIALTEFEKRSNAFKEALERILDFKFGWRGQNAHEDVEKLQKIAREALE